MELRLLRFLVFCILPIFTTGSKWPWSDLDDVDYILSTYGNEDYYFKIPIKGQELLDHGFNPEHPTAFVVHGWVQSGEDYCYEFLDAYHNDPNDPYNVICVDWDQLASIDNYLGAAYSSNTVGAHVGANLTVKVIFTRKIYKISVKLQWFFLISLNRYLWMIWAKLGIKSVHPDTV